MYSSIAISSKWHVKFVIFSPMLLIDTFDPRNMITITLMNSLAICADEDTVVYWSHVWIRWWAIETLEIFRISTLDTSTIWEWNRIRIRLIIVLISIVVLFFFFWISLIWLWILLVNLILLRSQWIKLILIWLILWLSLLWVIFSLMGINCSFTYIMNEFLIIIVGRCNLFSIVVGVLSNFLFVLVSIIANCLFVIIRHLSNRFTSCFQHWAAKDTFSNTFHYF